MNEKLTIVLVNRALPYNCVGKLTGRSGVEYGHSIYEPGLGAHVCRLTLEQWRACKEDVTYGFTRRWSQWEVDVEAKDEEGIGEGDEDDENRAERDSLPEAAHRVEAEATSNEGDREGVSRRGEDEITEEALGKIHNFRKLLALARRVGVADTDAFNATAEVRAAILARVRGGEADV